MAFCYPPLSKRMDAIRDWVCWGSGGATTVWRDQADGGRVREANDVWITIVPTRISRIGTDEIFYIDVDNEAGDAEWPVVEARAGLRKLGFEVRAFSRSQKHEMSAWDTLANVHFSVFSSYARQKYFSPNILSMANIGDIINMPHMRILTNRVEDVALFEIEMNTVLTSEDAFAVGTWIENILVSSDVQYPEGTSLSVQLDNEVM